jgi:hypothetical protein
VGDARARANIFLDDGLNNFASATAQIFPNGAGGVSFQDGSGEQATGLSYKTDTWRRWDLSYTIGTNSFSLSIDGVAAPNALTPWGTGPVSRLVLSNGSIASDGFFFVDANPQLQASTPEPTAWLLVAGGLAAVLAARNGVKRASIAEKVPCRRSGQSRPLLRPPSWTPGLASSPNRSRYVGLTPVPRDWSPRTDGLALCESRVTRSQRALASISTGK